MAGLRRRARTPGDEHAPTTGPQSLPAGATGLLRKADRGGNRSKDPGAAKPVHKFDGPFCWPAHAQVRRALGGKANAQVRRALLLASPSCDAIGAIAPSYLTGHRTLLSNGDAA